MKPDSVFAHMDVPLFEFHGDSREEEAVVRVLRSKWLSMGKEVARFEKEFASLCGVEYALAVSNCTAALHLALLAVGIKAGDEVIVPSLTFVATANTVCMTGATPVFADITSHDDWTISIDDVKRKITSRTKAIILVHYAGFMCDMEALQELAREHDLFIIEDAAHAPASTLDTKHAGSIGHAGCFSFYGNKNLSTGEGGMLTTNDPEVAEKVRLLRSHGLTTSAYDRVKGGNFYDVIDAGYNYRLPEMSAALGLVQLSRLEEDTAQRKRLFSYYCQRLSDIKGLHVPFTSHRGESSYHIMPVLLEHENRDKVREHLASCGIGTSIHYLPVHGFAHYRKDGVLLPLTEEVSGKMVTLPLYYNLTEEKIDYVCDRLAECLH